MNVETMLERLLEYEADLGTPVIEDGVIYYPLQGDDPGCTEVWVEPMGDKWWVAVCYPNDGDDESYTKLCATVDEIYHFIMEC